MKLLTEQNILHFSFDIPTIYDYNMPITDKNSMSLIMYITGSEEEKILQISTDYYSAVLDKDFDLMESYLHENIHFIGPLTERHNKKDVVEAAKNVSQIVTGMKIKSKFANGNQTMVTYDFIFPEPIGTFRTAVLMEFNNQLISKIEVFYDGHSYAKKKEQLLSRILTAHVK